MIFVLIGIYVVSIGYIVGRYIKNKRDTNKAIALILKQQEEMTKMNKRVNHRKD